MGADPSGLISYCESQGIQPEAYSPLGGGRLLKNFSLGDQPASLFVPDGPCPPAPPPPPPPKPPNPWVPADDCNPPCSSYAAAVQCCKDPSTGQDHGVCMKVSNCSDVGALQIGELVRLSGV